MKNKWRGKFSCRVICCYTCDEFILRKEKIWTVRLRFLLLVFIRTTYSVHLAPKNDKVDVGHVEWQRINGCEEPITYKFNLSLWQKRHLWWNFCLFCFSRELIWESSSCHVYYIYSQTISCQRKRNPWTKKKKNNTGHNMYVYVNEWQMRPTSVATDSQCNLHIVCNVLQMCEPNRDANVEENKSGKWCEPLDKRRTHTHI